jgi:hypothetical protein
LLDITDLEALDEEDWAPIRAISHERSVGYNTLSKPPGLLCDDGNLYWVKDKTQKGTGLSSELIGGRLASLVEAGPPARVVNVPNGIVDGDGNPIQDGLLVGSRDVPGTLNLKDPSIRTDFAPNKVDALTACRVVVLRAWLGLGDPQALIRAKTGEIYAIDFGDAFGNVDTAGSIAVHTLPRIPQDVQSNRRFIIDAVERIEDLSRATILKSVAQMPNGTAWNADLDHRYAVYQWLVARREILRKEVERWLTK